MEDGADARISLKLSLPVDGHSCVRSECPSCGLEFKIDLSEELHHDVLAWTVGRVLRSEGVGDTDAEEPTSSTTCPYCGHAGKPQDFLHPEHESYIERVVVREYVEPMFSEMLDAAFGGLRNSKFLQLTRKSGPRSIRPMLGPEATDMVRIRCLACSTLFKLAAGWRGSVRCTSCATELLAI